MLALILHSRWRVLALKVKFGLGANFLAIKKRNLNDINTFIDQETEVVDYCYPSSSTFENQKTEVYQSLCSSLNPTSISGSNERRSDGLGGEMHEKKGEPFNVLSKLFLYLFSRRTNGTSDVVVFELAVLREGMDSRSFDLRIFSTAWIFASKLFLKTVMASLELGATVLMPL